MQEKEAKLKRKKRKRKKSGIGYLLLFTIIFITALWGLSYAIKSLSPNVDIEIGNNEALTLAEEETEVEIKTVDERLKWIQMEDELPTVAVRNPQNNEDKKTETEKKEITEEIKQEVKEETVKEPKVEEKTTSLEQVNKPIELPKRDLDFRLPTGNVIEPRQPISKSVTKVYLGAYDSIEEAIRTQQKITEEEQDMVPFIKSINGRYMVQIGSFSDQSKAIALSLKMKEKGYPSRTVTE